MPHSRPEIESGPAIEIGRRIGGCSVFSKNLWLGLGRQESVQLFVSRCRLLSEKQKAPFALWRGQSFPYP